MQVILSGSIGRAVSTTNTLLPDGSAGNLISEVPLRVRIAEAVSDWYLLRFTDPALVKAAQFIVKGAAAGIVGDLAFEDWVDENQVRRSKPIVTVSDLQLEQLPSV